MICRCLTQELRRWRYRERSARLGILKLGCCERDQTSKHDVVAVLYRRTCSERKHKRRVISCLTTCQIPGRNHVDEEDIPDAGQQRPDHRAVYTTMVRPQPRQSGEHDRESLAAMAGVNQRRAVTDCRTVFEANAEDVNQSGLLNHWAFRATAGCFLMVIEVVWWTGRATISGSAVG